MRKIVAVHRSPSVSVSQDLRDRLSFPFYLDVTTETEGISPGRYPGSLEWMTGAEYALKPLPPFIDDVQSAVHTRFRDMGFLDRRTDEAIETKAEVKFRKSIFSHLVGYTCPNDDFRNVEMVTEHVAWLFVLDNCVDDPGSTFRRSGARELKKLTDTLYLSVESVALGKIDSRFVLSSVGLESFDNLIASAAALGGVIYEKSEGLRISPAPFLNSLRKYLNAICAEATYRQSGTWRSPEGYAELRMKTSAVEDVLELIWLLNGIKLPPAVREDDNFISMINNANRFVSYVNDLFSLNNEIRENTKENMVLVLWHAQSGGPRSIKEAINQTIAMTNRSVTDFKNCYDLFFGHNDGAIKSTDMEQARRAVGYAIDLMIGNLQWSKETGRYRVDAEELAVTTVDLSQQSEDRGSLSSVESRSSRKSGPPDSDEY